MTHDVYLQSQTAWKFINRFDETSLTITSSIRDRKKCYITVLRLFHWLWRTRLNFVEKVFAQYILRNKENWIENWKELFLDDLFFLFQKCDYIWPVFCPYLEMSLHKYNNVFSELISPHCEFVWRLIEYMYISPPPLMQTQPKKFHVLMKYCPMLKT